MVKKISVLDLIKDSDENAEYVLSPFFFGSKPLEGDNIPKWGMTLLSAGSMRFRWSETNDNRKKLEKFFGKKEIVPIELIHSKTVVEADSAESTRGLQADGIISQNHNLLLSVTVADCVPIFLFDTKTLAFGIFHSGWKGTGIAGEGVRLFEERFGSEPCNIAAAIGPHIGECCYSVDAERGEYFAFAFGKQCVTPKSTLSLTEANLSVLKKAGIIEENIVVSTDCTCCTQFKSGKNVFGSFRREAAFLPGNIDNDERSRRMTVQAAVIG